MRRFQTLPSSTRKGEGRPQSRYSAPRDIGRLWPIGDFTDGACQDAASALNTGRSYGACTVLSGIANIGDGAAAEGLGALLFCDHHGTAERRAHCSIAPAFGADHRCSDAV